MKTTTQTMQAIQRAATKAFKKLLPERRSAWVGWADGTLVRSDRLNYICCTTADKQEIEAWNDGVPTVFGMQVDLYTDPDYPGLLRARQPRIAFTPDFPYVSIKFHRDNHTWPGPDTVPVELRQFMPLYPSVSGFTLTVRGGWVSTETGIEFFNTTTYDMTPNKPTSGARYALVTIDTEGELSVTNGTVKNLFTLVPSVDIPALPAGHTRICAIRLYAGQMSIKDRATNTDLIDLRYTGFGMDGISARWGSITGTLADQLDLQAALDLKLDTGNVPQVILDDLTSQIDGVVDEFTLAEEYDVASVYHNGQRVYEDDYTIVDDVLTLTFVPEVGDTLVVSGAVFAIYIVPLADAPANGIPHVRKDNAWLEYPEADADINSFRQGDTWKEAPATHIRVLQAPSNTNVTQAVNSTAYIALANWGFILDIRPFNYCRLVISGTTSQSGQTLTFQLARYASPGTSIAVSGDLLTIENPATGTINYSDWVAIDDLMDLTDHDYFVVAVKGSNSTVDFSGLSIEAQFK